MWSNFDHWTPTSLNNNISDTTSTSPKLNRDCLLNNCYKYPFFSKCVHILQRKYPNYKYFSYNTALILTFIGYSLWLRAPGSFKFRSTILSIKDCYPGVGFTIKLNSFAFADISTSKLICGKQNILNLCRLQHQTFEHLAPLLIQLS